jgi:glutamate synthase (NADPH/NADH) small chain
MVKPHDTGKKVAVVGSGPAGIACAVDLGREGHKVTIFESLHLPGGVLIYGIPEFRLPKPVVHSEIDYAVQCLGIEIKTDHIIGRTITLDELLKEYDAVFIGTGAGLPNFMKIPGINYSGVMSANEFLTRINLMKAYRFPEYDTPVKIGERVAVIGAGNVAMDSARCAVRLQKSIGIESSASGGEVHVIYRRSRDEVPARLEEFHHAEEEGIIFDFLTSPVEIFGDIDGNVTGIKCIRMKLGDADGSGRKKPIPLANSEFTIDVDTVIMALGTSPNPVVFTSNANLRRTNEGTVVADNETGSTSRERLWAGGDVVTGSATVISAMGAGKRAAADINGFLRKGT